MVALLMMSAKLANLCLPKMKVFWNIGGNTAISVHDVTNKTLSNVSSYILDVAMRL